MSFFIKSKQFNGTPKFTSDKRRKRKAEKIKDDEITSSEDEGEDNEQNLPDASSSEEEHETAQEKKLRLAKIYLEEIEKEERRRLENKEISKDIISERLKTDHLKQIGKYEITIADKYVGVVDTTNIKILKCKEQKNTVTCFCISSDDSWIFSGSKDGVVVKWSLKEYKKVGVIPFVKTNVEQIKGHIGCIYSISVSTDNKFLVVGDSSGMIQVWDPSTLNHLGTLKGHKKPVTGLCLKHHSHILYSASNDKSVRVWSLDEMSFVETLFGHQDGITCIDVLNSERPVSSGGRDGTVRLWKVAEESQLIFNAHPENIDSVKLINDQHFVTGGDLGQVSIWSCIKKKPLCTVKAAHGSDPTNSQPYWISAVGSHIHSDIVASGSQDGYIRLWKIEDKYRKINKLFDIPLQGFVNALSFTSDGKNLIAGVGKDHRLGRWSTVKSAKNGVYVIHLQMKETT